MRKRIESTSACKSSVREARQALEPSKPLLGGKDTIFRYYEAYNAGDLETIASLLDEDCSYHDMIYNDPFEGREAVLEYLAKVRKIVPQDLKFVIEDVTEGDPKRVGIAWHVECGTGTVFPFSRGCSFYTLNDKGQILRGRDIVESALKPGTGALSVLAAVTPLVRKLGPRADPANLKNLPIKAAAVWAFYVGYVSYVLFSSSAPGSPVFQTPPAVLLEIFHESLNFGYVNVALDALGLAPVPNIAAPPVSEAVFNFVLAWQAMFLPFMLTDRAAAKVQNKVAWWGASMMITNLCFIPFLALRAAPDPPEDPSTTSTTTTSSGGSSSGDGASSSASDAPAMPQPPRRRRAQRAEPPPLPGWSAAVGASAGLLGVVSLAWAVVGRPEFGDLGARWTYLLTEASINRAFFAFLLDAVLFAFWQRDFMQDAPATYRNIPFFGMAAWLITSNGKKHH